MVAGDLTQVQFCTGSLRWIRPGFMVNSPGFFGELCTQVLWWIRPASHTREICENFVWLFIFFPYFYMPSTLFLQEQTCEQKNVQLLFCTCQQRICSHKWNKSDLICCCCFTSFARYFQTKFYYLSVYISYLFLYAYYFYRNRNMNKETSSFNVMNMSTVIIPFVLNN